MTIDLATAKAASEVAYEKHNLSKYPPGYQLDKELSNSNETVLFNKDTNQAILSHRGTSNARDIISDVALATGMRFLDPRFRHAKKKTKKFNKKYKDSEKVVVGHSLGGSLSEYGVNQKHMKKTPIITFNKGAGLYDWNNTRLKNQTDVRTKQDLVSFTSKYQRGGKTKQVRAKKNHRNAYGAHLLENMNI